MSTTSLNLTARDFDAYRAEKATSNAYSRPRLEVKQRALSWGRRVTDRLSALGIAADMHASDEHPSLRNKKRVDCQWVFFWRDQEAREELDRLLEQGRSISAAIDDPSPYTRHAFLALRLDAESIEVCFAVHPDAKVDVDNLRARLATAGSQGSDGEAASAPGEATLAAEFTSALRALPEQFLIGVSHDDRVECGATTADAIVGMLERAAGGEKPLWIGWSVPRETALAHADLIDEQLEDAIIALAPIYRLVAWSRENDHIALDRRIEGLEQAKAKTHAEIEAQNEKWRAEQAAQRERSQKEAQARLEEAARGAASGREGPPAPARRPSLDNLFKPRGGKPEAHSDRPEARRDGRQHAPNEARQHAPNEARSHAHAEPRAHAAHAEAPTSEPREAHSEPRAPVSGSIEKGSRVRVLAGPFADKVGVVSELDGRGGARVLLGLLSTRLEVAELALALAPEDRERPAPDAKGRRPIAPAPRKTR